MDRKLRIVRISRINRMVTQSSHDMRSMGDVATTDYVVQGPRSASDPDQAGEFAEMKLQADRLEARINLTVAGVAVSERAATKRIDPTGYYSCS